MHATKHPQILDGVVFETDLDFKTHYVDQTGDKELSNVGINKFIYKQLMECLNVDDQMNNFDGAMADQSMRLYLTDSEDSENFKELNIIQSKEPERHESNRRKLSHQAKANARDENEERMNRDEFLEWSEQNLDQDIIKRIEAGDTNWKFL
tara:strand:- start:175 stop:627 length:453 start_codon:yes stop_codon:yes gene_type:complete